MTVRRLERIDHPKQDSTLTSGISKAERYRVRDSGRQPIGMDCGHVDVLPEASVRAESSCFR